MKKVLAFGSFDHIHKGHMFYLRESKKYGDKLIVVLARDITIKKIKGKKPKYNEKERYEHLMRLKLADQIIMGDLNDPYKVIGDVKPDIICLGYDQAAFVDNLETELKKRNLDTRIIRLKPYIPEKYKSSKLKNKKS